MEFCSNKEEIISISLIMGTNLEKFSISVSLFLAYVTRSSMEIVDNNIFSKSFVPLSNLS